MPCQMSEGQEGCLLSGELVISAPNGTIEKMGP
jgi:hypothetical protein